MFLPLKLTNHPTSALRSYLPPHPPSFSSPSSFSFQPDNQTRDRDRNRDSIRERYLPQPPLAPWAVATASISSRDRLAPTEACRPAPAAAAPAAATPPDAADCDDATAAGLCARHDGGIETGGINAGMPITPGSTGPPDTPAMRGYEWAEAVAEAVAVAVAEDEKEGDEREDEKGGLTRARFIPTIEASDAL
jgi:hypothetical protein